MNWFMLRMIRDTDKSTSEYHRHLSHLCFHTNVLKSIPKPYYFCFRDPKTVLLRLYLEVISPSTVTFKSFFVLTISRPISSKCSEVITTKNLYTLVNTQRCGECSLLTFLSGRNSSALCSQLTVKPTWLFTHRNEFFNDGKWLKLWLQQSSAGEKR